jgi:hypothetical protein
MTGLKTLDLSDGNWEMVWRDDSAGKSDFPSVCPPAPAEERTRTMP